MRSNFTSCLACATSFNSKALLSKSLEVIMSSLIIRTSGPLCYVPLIRARFDLGVENDAVYLEVLVWATMGKAALKSVGFHINELNSNNQ